MSLYGKLTPEKVIKEYVGLKTSSAVTRIDNINNTIKVEINKEFVSVKDIKIDGISIVEDREANIILKDFIKEISFNEETGALTFTKEDNSTIEIDLPTEKIVKSGHYDNSNKDIVLVLSNDEEIRIPVQDLTSDIIKTDGDGDKFLSDDGEYKPVSGGIELVIREGF